MSDCNVKRKRLANTTDEQYEEYLTLMENDFVFRSGIVNPTLGDDYVANKWKELGSKLNSLGNGPTLSTEVWKKRFNDWKNATRSKQRRIQEHRYKTGGGSETIIKLTPLEKRAINVWGKVAVTVSCQVLATGGLPSSCRTDMDMGILKLNANDRVNQDQMTSTSLSCLAPSPTVFFFENENGSISSNEQQESSIFIKTPHKKKTPQKTRYPRQNKPLNDVAESLLTVYKDNVLINKELNNNLTRYGDLYKEIEEQKIMLQSKRLEFDIAKYKYENKDFVFN